ncbi:MAG: NAD+ diphosphatase [Parasphingorhabdus sp.]
MKNEISPPIYFVQEGYDRQSLHRKRKGYFQSSIENKSCRILFMFEGKIALINSPTGLIAAFIGADQLEGQQCSNLENIFLGELDGNPVFCVSCDEHPRSLLKLGVDKLIFSELRQVSPQLPHNHASIMGFAQAMCHWHRKHQYCGSCGRSTTTEESGHSRVCSNSNCNTRQFPRTDPAVIMLVYNDDSCLLGRQRDWPDRRYSTIAGYVEPGETPEQAVVREVYEETGVDAMSVRYFASQPWPFPGSLMLGYYATAAKDIIHLNDGELQDARWFSKADIADRVPSGKLRLPTRISIAYRLLENWFNHNHDLTLNDLNPDSN